MALCELRPLKSAKLAPLLHTLPCVISRKGDFGIKFLVFLSIGSGSPAATGGSHDVIQLCKRPSRIRHTRTHVFGNSEAMFHVFLVSTRSWV